LVSSNLTPPSGSSSPDALGARYRNRIPAGSGLLIVLSGDGILRLGTRLPDGEISDFSARSDGALRERPIGSTPEMDVVNVRKVRRF